MTEPTPRQPFPWSWLAGLLAVALALRLIGLGERSLWLDEWVSLRVAAEPWLDVARGRVFDNHTPPLYYLLLNAWLRVVPADVTGLRSLSLLLDVAALGLFTGVVYRCCGRRVAFLAGAAWALSPFAVRLAQEGRMYPLLLLLVVAVFGLALELERRRDRLWPAAGAAVVAAAALYTHYYAALFLLVLHGAMAWRLRRAPRAALAWWGAMTVAGLAFLPWLPVVLELLASDGQAHRPFGASVVPYAGFRLALGWAVIPLDVMGKSDLGAAVRSHLPLLLACVAAAGGVLALGGRRAWAAPSPAGRFSLALALVPPVVAAAVTTVVRSLDARYLAICFPFLLLLAALAPWGRRQPRWWLPVQVLALGLFVYAAAAHLADPAAGSTPWRRAAAELRAAAPSGAVIAVHPPQYASLLEHHLGGGREVVDLDALERLDGEAWLVEVAFLERVGPELRRADWEVAPHRLLPAGNGLRLSLLRRRPAAVAQ